MAPSDREAAVDGFLTKIIGRSDTVRIVVFGAVGAVLALLIAWQLGHMGCGV